MQRAGPRGLAGSFVEINVLAVAGVPLLLKDEDYLALDRPQRGELAALRRAENRGPVRISALQRRTAAAWGFSTPAL